jgi:hypothetical protein
MYIEDLTHYIRDPSNCVDNSKLSPRDKSVIFSMSSQLLKSTPLALTEKQASLLLSIFQNNMELYKDIPNYEFLVNNPIYKYPFRALELEKKIYLDENEGKKYIRVKLPFDKKINKIFSTYRGDYTFVNREKFFYLTDKNIYGIIEYLKEFEFEIDPTLHLWYNEIKEIKDNFEEYKPIVDYVDNTLVLRNSHKSVVNYFNKNRSNSIIPDIFLARSLGLSPSKQLTEQISSISNDELVQNMLKLDGSTCSLSENINLKTAIDAIQQWPILVVLTDERNLHTTLDGWYKMFKSIGVSKKEMTVLFRSQMNKKFNELIKQNSLNNMLDENTKVVFVKSKLPKVLYRTGFKPKFIITSGMYFSHTSIQKLIEHHPYVLYYTDTNLKTILGRNIVKM